MDGQDTKWHRNIASNFNRLSRAHERYRRQMAGRWHIANVNLSSHSLKTNDAIKPKIITITSWAYLHKWTPTQYSDSLSSVCKKNKSLSLYASFNFQNTIMTQRWYNNVCNSSATLNKELHLVYHTVIYCC